MKASFKEKIYTFEIPKKDVNVMTANAIRQEENVTKKKLDLGTMNEERINHILLNYIRHQMVKTYHEKSVYFAHSDAVTEKEYYDWFKAVNDAIGQTYPFLKKVIRHQLKNKRRRLFGK